MRDDSELHKQMVEVMHSVIEESRQRVIDDAVKAFEADLRNNVAKICFSAESWMDLELSGRRIIITVKDRRDK